ncbi:MAG: hypothetical protein D6785_04945 [Planctomycetota bacterium]|nr:MAG: hypothetical protein D6785_04945 [Planctomycetota bacterium]
MKKTLWKYLVFFLVTGFFGTFILLVAALGYGWKTYQEERIQPIDYSHQIHVQKNNMKCTQCHLNVDRGPQATVPPVSICMKCHKTVKTDSPKIQKLTRYWKQGLPVPWKKVHVIPRPGMVHFTHKRHVKFFMPRHLADEFEKQGVPRKVAEILGATFGKRVTKKYDPAEVQAVLLSQGVSLEEAKKIAQKWNTIQNKSLKATCYACHGMVEYMKTPRKMAPLKMGWCVTCHVKYQGPRDCTTCHQ